MAILLNILPSIDSLINISYVILGLGLVIFFHELGHFAVAKWCNVFVERFSIGFGPILLSRKWGETEYALSAIPFGGYVKMLGQDDMDPAQMSDEDIAEDPRSYTAKKVWQRMAIISAGVIMNVITAMLFFAAAFTMGVQKSPPIVGSTEIGMPAWEAGLEEGDEILTIDGKKMTSYEDIYLSVALSSGPLEVVVKKWSGEVKTLTISPDQTGMRRQIGVSPARSLELANFPAEIPLTSTGSAAENADPPFKAQDKIVSVDDVPLQHFYELQNYLARNSEKEVDFKVVRTVGKEGRNPQTEELTIHVPTNRMLELGAVMDIGTIKFIKRDSPAQKAGLKVGDKISLVTLGDQELEVGRELDPFRLPEFLAREHGKKVILYVRREAEEAAGGAVKPAAGGADEKKGLLKIEIVPDDIPAWTEFPSGKDTPLSAPCIGVAYEITRTVLHVKPGSPAEGKLKVGDRIRAIEYLPPPKEGNAAKKTDSSEELRIEFADAQHKDRPTDWAYSFLFIQTHRDYQVKLSVSREGEKETLDFLLTPEADENNPWYFTKRGFSPGYQMTELIAGSFGESIPMGLHHTKNKILEIYSTLRSLVRGDLSFKNFRGPLGIAKIAYTVAQHGLAELLLFLGILSVNLAVLNFLPIPVLDGGHMVFLIWEGVTGKKPTEKVLAAATYVGVLFILGLIGLVMYLDIFIHGLTD
ncbi:MAG TPA: RIP metalloprotease RseP [Planctomycetaceae bacterium]|nr:RIP metalloprotease RseP [Planctomycetaceae bacterium]